MHIAINNPSNVIIVVLRCLLQYMGDL